MKNKLSIAITMLITLLLASSTFVSIAFCPYPPSGTEIPTYSNITVGPNPVGINQEVTINLFNAVPTITSEPYYGLTVEVTDPSGHTTTLGPFDSDTTGGTFTTFTPDQVGIWEFQMFSPGQTLSRGYIQLPGESKVFELKVQEDPVGRESYPSPPGPEHYWETPVNAMNAEKWYDHMGEWWGLSGITFEQTGSNYNNGNYNPYTDSVYSGHVLWTKPWGAGGVAGGESGIDQVTGHFWTTRQYQPQYAPIILEGVMYSVLWTTSQSSAAHNGIIATDLFSGETLWTIEDTQETLRVGWSPTWHNLNEYGTLGPYLITTGSHPGVTSSGTTYNIYDATTGKYMASIVNGESMTLIIDDDRDLVGFYQEVSGSDRYLIRWDMTECVGMTTNGEPGFGWGLNQDATYQFDNGIVFSEPMMAFADMDGVTDPSQLSGGGFMGQSFRISGVTNDEVVFTGGYTLGQGVGGETNGWLTVATMDKNTGAQLWGKNLTYAESPTFLPFTRTEMGMQDGLWINANMENFIVEAWDTRTGEKAWTSELTGDNGAEPHYFDAFNLRWSPGPEGASFFRGYGGDIWCIEHADGNVRWYTNTTKLVGPPGADSPYNVWLLWVFECDCITNNVAYFPIGHEYNPPLFPGAQMCAVNITDGSLVWSELGMYIRSTSCAYDILLSLNAYDNQIYAWGKGPSATSVAASPKVTVHGNSVIIEGSVTDISAGTNRDDVAANFPNGVPCVSDESMSDWMEYVYMQQAKPEDVEGVKVFVKIQDPNGDWYSATVTTDENGVFSHMWAPAIVGEYKVTAMFEGSNSYWPSEASTAFGVDEAPAAEDVPSAAEIAETTVNQMPAYPTIPEIPAYLTIDLVILIIAVVVLVIGLLAYMALRKQK
ncbi:MAG: PQQ-binding-like beta-propeller repeat protein [Candidatus Bathyarchaeota archaeon]|jgi:hypothetical protein